MPPRLRILAHHLILSSYGFWLANDPRGSGSDELREGKFADLGPIHHGRKWTQPSRAVLRAFYAHAFPRLDHAPFWFDVWACFIGSNHAHLCVRFHRDRYEKIWEKLTAQSRTSLIAAAAAPEFHPVWAQRPYSVYCHTPDDIQRVVGYINANAPKEGLPPHNWDFVKPYDGWPTR